MAEAGAQKPALKLVWAVLATCLLLVGTVSRAASARDAKGPSGGSGGGGGGTRLMVSGKYLHLSCTRSLRDLKTNKLECFGNVYIRRPSELLTADYAIMDLNTEQLHAEGNVVYFTPDTVIYGSAMDFNFVTETGVIKDGRVESDKYQLLGESIERLAINHFVAQDGEYTTCRDCPASWKLSGKTVDMTVDGYAYLNQVFIKLNDASALYLPYAVIPVKTKRQSGLLFPHIQLAGPNGFSFVQPYFWAISRSMDATLGAGFYSLRGPKAEAEYRYALGPRTNGQLNAYYLRDKSFIRDPYYDRWAINYTHNVILPWSWEFKLSYLDASDRDYSSKIGDIPGRGEPGLISDLGLSRPSRDAAVWFAAKRVHNQLTPGLTGFDANTVQILPSASVASTDHQIHEGLPLFWSVTGNYTRFYRLGPSFDPIYPPDFQAPSQQFFLPGQTPLRRASRFNLVPEIYYTQKIADVIDIVPSAQYRTYGYFFDEGVAAPTARGYLLAQAEVSTTIEKVYGDVVKHKFRPALTYSNIPVIQQNNSHPFIQQLRTAGNEFDENDIVPISNDSQLYFVPLGNSLTYQLGNKFILKKGEGSYEKTVDVVSGQSVNFIEFRKSANPQPLSRFFTLATMNTKRVQASAEYYYYPYIRTPTYNLGVTYVFARYTRRVLSFERSLNLSYSYNQVLTNANSIGGTLNFSINDYFSFLVGIGYNFPQYRDNAETPGTIQSISGGITYQSPSQCYKLVLLASRTIDNPNLAVTFNIPVNLTGDGFTNLQEGGGLVPGQGTPGH